MPREGRDAAASAQWFLRVHPLVWVAAGIGVLLLAARSVGEGTFTWLAPLGLAGFWLIVTLLVVFVVVLLLLTKKRPYEARRP